MVDSEEERKAKLQEQVNYLMDRASDHWKYNEFSSALQEMNEAWKLTEFAGYEIPFKMGRVYAQAEHPKRSIKILKACLKLMLAEEQKLADEVKCSEEAPDQATNMQIMHLFYEKLKVYQLIG